MAEKEEILNVNYPSVFTSKESQQKETQPSAFNRLKSQFTSTQTHIGTFGTSTFICMDGRRKYKYNEK